MAEIAMGCEISRCVGCAVVNASVAAEWQHWTNFTAELDPAQSNSLLAGPADVGFGGIVVGVGVEY